MAVITETRAERAVAPAVEPAGVVTAKRILHFGFTILPIIAGLDKFFHVLVNWNIYASPIISNNFPGGAGSFMNIAGAIEIAAGILVGFAPAVGGTVVGIWLLGIVANLLTIPGYYDIALRDFGLALGAFSLSALSSGLARKGVK